MGWEKIVIFGVLGLVLIYSIVLLVINLSKRVKSVNMKLPDLEELDKKDKQEDDSNEHIEEMTKEFNKNTKKLQDVVTEEFKEESKTDNNKFLEGE